MTGRLRRAEILAVILLLGPSAAYAAGLPQAPQEVQPIDRWLVSSPFPTDGGGGDSPLTGPGEEGVLPDRGQELAGSTWTLVRIDGRSELRLDTLFPDRSPPEFVYSHAYLRLQRDRTMALVIEGLGDGRLRTWVNGRVLKTADGAPLEVTEADTVRVRLGAGWNTLLVRAEGGGDGFGLAAGLAARDGGPPVRVQASRPPGDVRTGPLPFILVGGSLDRTGRVAWVGDELLGELALEVTAWSRTPIDTVRARVRGSGLDARGGARWLTPGAPVPIGLWAPLDRLRDLAASSALEVELKWADEESRQRVSASTGSLALPLDSAGISLAGWEVRTASSEPHPDRVDPAGPLPDSPGWTLAGEWRVPDELAGRDLVLSTAGAPGDYRVGDRAFRGDEEVPLCRGCRKGEKIEILALSRQAWSALPSVHENRAGPDVGT